MNLIFNNQFSIFEDIFYVYLTPKQCIKLYSTNKILYNIYIINNRFEDYYFTPRSKEELEAAIDDWYNNREEALIIYGDIGYWNIIYITDISYLFHNKQEFNDDISDWNTSNTINMTNMFYIAEKFNQDISNWNVNNVIYMTRMFGYSTIFNQNLNKWNIKNVKYLNNIFYNSINFDILNYKDWDLSNIKYKFNMFNVDLFIQKI